MELDGQPVTVSDVMALALGNYGHFTTMRVADLRVRGLRLHLDRLVRDCRVVFAAELDADRVRALVRRVAERAGTAVMVRVTVFDPEVTLARSAGPARPRVLVTTRPVPAAAAPPVRLRSVRYARELAAVKHTGLFGPVHHRRSAQHEGFDDVLFVDPTGRITEGATWNIAFVRGGEVVLPAGDCLPGVTMALVRQAMDERGIAYRCAPLRLADVADGAAAFITNASMGVAPVRAIDDLVLAETDVLPVLRQAYRELPGEPL